MKKPKPVQYSETAYMHLHLQAQVISAVAIVLEAEINAGTLHVTRRGRGYDEIHTALAEALSLLRQVRDALWAD